MIEYITQMSPIITGLDGRIEFADPGEQCSLGGAVGLVSSLQATLLINVVLALCVLLAVDAWHC